VRKQKDERRRLPAFVVLDGWDAAVACVAERPFGLESPEVKALERSRRAVRGWRRWWNQHRRRWWSRWRGRMPRLVQLSAQRSIYEAYGHCGGGLAGVGLRRKFSPIRFTIH
jgi:hypothetical protein